MSNRTINCECGHEYEQADYWRCPKCEAKSPDLLAHERRERRAAQRRPKGDGLDSLRELLRFDK